MREDNCQICNLGKRLRTNNTQLMKDLLRILFVELFRYPFLRLDGDENGNIQINFQGRKEQYQKYFLGIWEDFIDYIDDRIDYTIWCGATFSITLFGRKN